MPLTGATEASAQRADARKASNTGSRSRAFGRRTSAVQDRLGHAALAEQDQPTDQRDQTLTERNVALAREWRLADQDHVRRSFLRFASHRGAEDHDRESEPPRRGTEREQLQRFANTFEIRLTAQTFRVGARKQQTSAFETGRAEQNAAVRELDRLEHVAGIDRRLGSAHEPRAGTLGLTSRFVVIGQDLRVLFVISLEPVADDAVRAAAVLIGQHRVGRIAEQRVPEAVLGSADVAGIGNTYQEFGLCQRVEQRPRLRATAEHLLDAAVPAAFSEHAGDAQRAARLGIELLDSGLRHCQHRVGPLGAARCHAPNQLFDVKRIPVGGADDPSHYVVVGSGLERGVDEPFRCSGDQTLQTNPERRVIGQLRKLALGFGTRKRKHHQRPLGSGANGFGQETHAGRVTPVQILEHDNHGLTRSLRIQPAV